ncbi:MAG: hypothetical protein ACE5WD_12865 [Candidatus Aminicenantia bacterium]
MKNKLIVFGIAFLLISLSLLAQEETSLAQDITVRKDEIQDNVITFGGNILVEGKVRDSVIAFGGRITINGEVGDAVVGLGSVIKLGPSARIKGDLVALGGHLEKDVGSVVEGDTLYFKTTEDLTKILSQALKGIFSISFVPFILVLKFINIFIWFILAILLVAIFPNQISFASSQIEKSFWPICGTGFLAIIIFTGLVLFSALLCFFLIGIPLIFLLVLLGFIIQFFGRIVLFYFFGEKLLQAFNSRQTSGIIIVIVGVVIVSIIRFIPAIGLLFAFCLSIIGWGVVIRTKFGTKENWFRKTSS